MLARGMSTSQLMGKCASCNSVGNRSCLPLSFLSLSLSLSLSVSHSPHRSCFRPLQLLLLSLPPTQSVLYDIDSHIDRERFIVYCTINDVVILVTGSEEYEELGSSLSSLSLSLSLLVGVLRCLTGAMRGVIKKDITEHHILQRYASVRIAVDELVNQGTLEQVDSTYITRMNKMEIKE
eukprot:TRINITY_DN2311_c0_g1_i5.p1 TRINITY_DN2311_c0_g1~~TRINITY_DN2311_c0_g1_i5.p1  ORF type:complete len:179 (-),score=27.54 TRINITY_DN2311_c0_g1_i5:33-569(-)